MQYDRKANDQVSLFVRTVVSIKLSCVIVKQHIDTTCVLAASKVIINKSRGGVSLKSGQNKKGHKSQTLNLNILSESSSRF